MRKTPIAVSVALTGARYCSRKSSGEQVASHMPLSPTENLKDSDACADAGAQYQHFHPRNDKTGEQYADPDWYNAVAHGFRSRQPKGILSFGSSRKGAEVCEAIQTYGESARSVGLLANQTLSPTSQTLNSRRLSDRVINVAPETWSVTSFETTTSNRAERFVAWASSRRSRSRRILRALKFWNDCSLKLMLANVIERMLSFYLGFQPRCQLPVKCSTQQSHAQQTLLNRLVVSCPSEQLPILDGHMLTISIELQEKNVELDAVIATWRGWNALPQELQLPSAAIPAIRIRTEMDRPQTRLDRMAGRGMGTTVGRLRECNVLDFRLIALSHNMIRGAAGASVLNAELLYSLGKLN